MKRLARETVFHSRALSSKSLAVNPARLVIVCISGYDWSSSLQDEAFLRRIQILAEQEGKSPEEYIRQFEREVVAPAREKRLHGDGRTGMEKLRDRLASDLAKDGVLDTNILHSPWSTPGNDGMNDEPHYDALNGKISAKKPQKLVLIGHSYGGWTACRLSRVTVVRPTYMGLLDPMFSFKMFRYPIVSGPQSEHPDNYPKGGSIRSWWQDGGQPYGCRDVHKEADDGQKIRVGNHKVGGESHMTIDDSKLLHDSIVNAMRQLLSGMTDWPDDKMREGAAPALEDERPSKGMR